MRTEAEKLDRDKLEKFMGKVYKDFEKKFGTDNSGDSKVEFIVVDRTRYWPMHYFPIPYDHSQGEMTEEEIETVEDLRLTNLDIALKEVQMAYKHKRINRQIKKEKSNGGRGRL